MIKLLLIDVAISLILRDFILMHWKAGVVIVSFSLCGALLNTLVVVMNQGMMPSRFGILDGRVRIHSKTRLVFLADVFPLRTKKYIFHYSIGDALIAISILGLVFFTIPRIIRGM